MREINKSKILDETYVCTYCMEEFICAGWCKNKMPKELAYILKRTEEIVLASEVEIIDDTSEEEKRQSKADSWIKRFKEHFK